MNNKTHLQEEIRAELENISRVVSKKITPERRFDIPKEYFEEIENKVCSQLNISNQLGYNHVYSVQEDYFSNLEAKIISQVVIDKTWRVRKMIALFSSVAAMFLVILFAIKPVEKSEPIDPEDMAWVYLSENVDAWDMDDMINIEVIDEELLEEIETDQLQWLNSVQSDTFFE